MRIFKLVILLVFCLSLTACTQSRNNNLESKSDKVESNNGSSSIESNTDDYNSDESTNDTGTETSSTKESDSTSNDQENESPDPFANRESDPNKKPVYDDVYSMNCSAQNGTYIMCKIVYEFETEYSNYDELISVFQSRILEYEIYIRNTLYPDHTFNAVVNIQVRRRGKENQFFGLFHEKFSNETFSFSNFQHVDKNPENAPKYKQEEH